ncbi:MAG: thioesterase family protein [Geminicoccaceae bacterium]
MALAVLERRVPPAWVDWNEHMSAACFALAFAEANDQALAGLGFDAGYRQRAGCACYVVEALYRYRRELRLGDALRIETWLSHVDAKRLRLGHVMTQASGARAAEAEILFLHVAWRQRRVVPFEADLQRRLEALVTPGAASGEAS